MDDAEATGSDCDYGVTARFYDLIYAELAPKDVEFYCELAAEANGDVLELACGTGRVTIPLAQSGINITGLDKSKMMMGELRRKLEKELPAVRERVELVDSDMTCFDFGERRFAMIIIPFRSFLHVLNVDTQRDCLQCIRHHLAPGGVYVHNVFNPDLKYIVAAMQSGGTWQKAGECANPDTGHIIQRSVILNPNPGLQQHQIRWKFEVFDHFGKLQETHVEDMSLRWQYRYEAEYLLELCGFEIAAAFGDYQKTPLDDSARELIYVCR